VENVSNIDEKRNFVCEFIDKVNLEETIVFMKLFPLKILNISLIAVFYIPETL